MAGEGAVTEDDNSGKLPAEKIYNKFDNKSAKCRIPGTTLTTYGESLKKELSGYENIKSYVEDIVRVWCIVSEIRENDSLYNERCGFLYFWLGNKLFSEGLDTTNFKGDMNKIYTLLASWFSGEDCKNEYRINSKHDFNQRKTIFDYWYNYPTIQKYIHDNHFDCPNKYATYLNEVAKDYSDVSSSCSRQRDDEYCKQINDVLTDNNSPTTLKFECESINEKDFKLIEENKSHVDEKRRERTNAFFYRQFNQGSGLNSCADLSGIDKIFEDHDNLAAEKAEIQSAWCEMAKKKGAEGDDDVSFCKYCNFLYFWIGDELWGKLISQREDSDTFNKIMSLVCAKLMELCNNSGGCKMACWGTDSQIDRTNFHRKKEEYTNTQEQQTQSRTRAHPERPPDTDHLEDESGDEIGEEEGSPELVGSFSGCSPGGVPLRGQAASCPLPPDLSDSSAEMGTSRGDTTSGYGTTITPAAVSSSAAALIGLPTIIFLLYKKINKKIYRENRLYNYTPFLSRIKNSSGKGNRNRSSNRSNRKKRSTIRNDFEIFTDSSTEYSGEVSTVVYNMPPLRIIITYGFKYITTVTIEYKEGELWFRDKGKVGSGLREGGE
ncbi:CYIR protein [Plasmodium coatneyi]|uniref:CYIR protein n=1 Tax=Plasmodium coatneyi TaxID=208452 RepID=A0A1B1E502_9APIC|nr:CYIR protein [Plasmodium coatneyi]ANQ10104.1 CYIR protein [Plasmodium coatneyi]